MDSRKKKTDPQPPAGEAPPQADPADAAEGVPAAIDDRDPDETQVDGLPYALLAAAAPALPAAQVAAPPDDVWSTWTPASDADVELRWLVQHGARGDLHFDVEVYAVTHLALPSPLPLRLSRSFAVLRRRPLEQQRVIQLVVQTTLTREEREVPFSLYSSHDPKPRFAGTFQAEYPESDAGEPQARLLVRNLSYNGGDVPLKVLYPPLPAEPAATRSE